jgi:hypothetical protein
MTRLLAEALLLFARVILWAVALVVGDGEFPDLEEGEQ